MSPAISRGTARNRISIRAQGSSIVIRINGQIAGNARDDTFAEGQFGFGVGNFKDGVAEARFDHLVVTSVEPSPGAPAARTGATATPSAVAPPVSTSSKVEQLVRDYYSAIDERRYRDAYQYLSTAEQSRLSYADFERLFAPTLISLRVRSVDVLSLDSTAASLAVQTTTVSQEGSRQVTACWQVGWELISEGGQWKRASMSQVGENC
jgi:hypothetical protein